MDFFKYSTGDPDPVHAVRANGSLQGRLPRGDGELPTGCDIFGSTGDGVVWRVTGLPKDWVEVPLTHNLGYAPSLEPSAVTALLSDGTVTSPIPARLVSQKGWVFSSNATDGLPGMASDGHPLLVVVDPTSASFRAWSLPHPTWLPSGEQYIDPYADEGNQEVVHWLRRLRRPPDWLMVDDQQRYWLGFTLAGSGDPPSKWSPWHRSASKLAWQNGKIQHMPELRVAIWRPGKSIEWRRYPWPSCGPSGSDLKNVPDDLLQEFTAGCEGVFSSVAELGPFVRFTWEVGYHKDAEGNPVKAISGFPWYPTRSGSMEHPVTP